MPRAKTRAYQSPVRQRQAEDTRRRIADAARRLLRSKGYSAMTVDAIAAEAGVAAPTVYAIFGSKTGILTELLDQSTFGPEYENLVEQARGTPEPEMRLRIAAKIARQVHDAAGSALDLLKGAGVVAPQLARLLKDREGRRYAAQEHLIGYLEEHGKLRPGLNRTAAWDVLWSFTSRELYRLLVIERGWTSQAYEDWLADTLAVTLTSEGRSSIPR